MRSQLASMRRDDDDGVVNVPIKLWMKKLCPFEVAMVLRIDLTTKALRDGMVFQN